MNMRGCTLSVAVLSAVVEHVRRQKVNNLGDPKPELPRRPNLKISGKPWNSKLLKPFEPSALTTQPPKTDSQTI